MKLYTIDYIPGAEIEALGTVCGTTVQATHLGHDLLAGLKNLVGGEIEDYTEMLTKARDTAVARMTAQARELGADAVVNLRFGSASVMQSAAEVIAYGTAVRIKN
ncbi:MAG: YbjQ family protein [Oscillibacter sp.]|nr:YbjQ family protein [Oscillibacter sp.]